MAHGEQTHVTPNLVAGIGLMLVGLVLVLDRLGLVVSRELLRFWPVLLIVLGGVMIRQALAPRAAPLPDGGQRAPAFTPGFVVLIVLALILVSRAEDRGETRADADSAQLFALMGRDEHVSLATHFRGGGMTTVMGRTRLDLREASIPPGQEAVVEVVGVMGRLQIDVPPGWVVDVKAVPLMGAVRNDRARPARGAGPLEPPDLNLLEREGPALDTRPPRLVVRGVVLMGALRVR